MSHRPRPLLWVFEPERGTLAAMATGHPLSVMPNMADDLVRLHDELMVSVTSENPFLTEIAAHLIQAGGKRIRPGFSIAAAACGLGEDAAARQDVIRGGASVELVHLGSLYHDDVIDDASTRHFVASVNQIWGNHRAILAGDFLLARASEIAASLGTEVAGLLGATISRLVEGQILELQHLYDPDRSEDDYFRSIDGKTAALLATACRIGAIVGDLPRDQIEAVTTFGHRYGMAFQVVDDVLDLVSTDEQLGKPAGHDMVEGVYTLPVLRALSSSAGEQLRPLLTAGMDDPARLLARQLVRESGVIEDAIDVAREYASDAQHCLEQLPPSSGRRGLTAAADHLVAAVEAAAARQPAIAG